MAFLIDGKHRIKMGLCPEHTTGRMAYRREVGAVTTLIVRCFGPAPGLDYVDIFYSHRFDPATPLEETMGALDHIVRSGRALYVGISSYNSARTREAAAILRELGTPFLIHQPSYNMFNRWVERDKLRLDTGIPLPHHGVEIRVCLIAHRASKRKGPRHLLASGASHKKPPSQEDHPCRGEWFHS